MLSSPWACAGDSRPEARALAASTSPLLRFAPPISWAQVRGAGGPLRAGQAHGGERDALGTPGNAASGPKGKGPTCSRTQGLEGAWKWTLGLLHKEQGLQARASGLSGQEPRAAQKEPSEALGVCPTEGTRGGMTEHPYVLALSPDAARPRGWSWGSHGPHEGRSPSP